MATFDSVDQVHDDFACETATSLEHVAQMSAQRRLVDCKLASTKSSTYLFVFHLSVGSRPSVRQPEGRRHCLGVSGGYLNKISKGCRLCGSSMARQNSFPDLGATIGAKGSDSDDIPCVWRRRWLRSRCSHQNLEHRLRFSGPSPADRTSVRPWTTPHCRHPIGKYPQEPPTRCRPSVVERRGCPRCRCCPPPRPRRRSPGS